MPELIEIGLKILIPILLAWGSAAVVSHYSEIKKSPSFGRLDRIDFVKAQLEKVIFYIFLPFVLAFSVFKSDININHLSLFLAGVCIPFFTLVFMKGFLGDVVKEKNGFSFWRPYFPATFGGGNRGALLVILLSPIVIIRFGINLTPEEFLSYFAVVDLGNFLFLALYISRSMMKSAIPSHNEGDKIEVGHKGVISDAYQWFTPSIVGVAIVVSLLITLFDLSSLMNEKEVFKIKNLIFDISSHISAIFTYLVFFSIILLFKSGMGIGLGSWTKFIALGLTARFLSILFVAAILYFISHEMVIFSSDVFLASMFCIWLFLLLPPSSIFTIYTEQVIGMMNPEYVAKYKEAYGVYKKGISSLVLSSNILYMAIITVSIFYLLYRWVSS